MRIASFALMALLAAPASVAVVSAPAVAQTRSDCEAQLASLRSASGAVAISGRNAEKDRAGLVGKLTDASTELAKGKNADAAKKLADFKVKVGQLAEAGRISNADAASLTQQADSAIVCINGLGTSA
ncbi:MAG: FIMAH domain-containing protein [Sphingomicrobium sp.]